MAVFFIIIGVFLYFIPAWIASGKRNSTAIFLLNLFLGWTLLGWVGALIWACVDTPPTPPQPVFQVTPKEEKPDVVSQLEKISRLRENGFLTEEEFLKQKEKILRG